METYAHFGSRHTSEGLKIFRHHTEFRSPNGPGDAIGLVVMMNPGNARPQSEPIFTALQTAEYDDLMFFATLMQLLLIGQTKKALL